MTLNIPARPRRNDPEVIKVAVQSSLPRLQSWYEGAFNEDSDEEEILKLVASIVPYCDDGYEMAREMELKNGWSPDFELVEILENISTFKAHRDAIKQWVELWGITCDYKPGDRAVWQGQTGEIRKVDPTTTQITFLPDEERHKSSAVHPQGRGLHGYICYSDELTAEPAASEA